LRDIHATKDINPNLKKWLLALLSKCRSSIDLYYIHGAESFAEALKAAYAESVFYRETFDDLAANEGLSKKLWALLVKLNTFAKKAEEYKHLTHLAPLAIEYLPKLIEQAKHIGG
jgi:hypothetical protein